jgi:putative MFS transporter
VSALRAPGALGRGTVHGRATLVAALAFATNGLTLGILSIALLGLRGAWGLTPAQAGLLTMAAGAGQLLGGLVMGHAADRIGRRAGYGLTVALSGLATGLSAAAPSLSWLLPLVFLSGVGFGGVAPIVTSLVGEFAPPEQRGALMGWTQVVWILGWIAAVTGGAALDRALGWRAVFALGALPLVLGVLGPRLVPESLRFLLAHGRTQDAERLARDLARRFGESIALPPQEPAQPASLLEHLRELWGARFRRRTAVLWLVWFVMIGAYNGPVVWLPAIASASGVPHVGAATLVIAVSMLPTTVASTLVLDRVGRKPVMVGSLLLAALGALTLALARAEAVFVLGGAELAAGTLAAWPVVLSYAAELYPTRIRATAAGWASAAGRLAGVAAPAFLGAVMRTWSAGRSPALGTFAVSLGLAAGTVLLWGEETARRTLEDTAEQVAPLL